MKLLMGLLRNFVIANNEMSLKVLETTDNEDGD